MTLARRRAWIRARNRLEAPIAGVAGLLIAICGVLTAWERRLPEHVRQSQKGRRP